VLSVGFSAEFADLAAPPFRRADSMLKLAQHPAFGGGADSVSEAPQLAMDAAGSPAGILDAEPGDELVQFLREGRASWGQRLGPLFCDQVLVPGQQGAWGDDPMTPQYTG
jgi:hypothetical protein